MVNPGRETYPGVDVETASHYMVTWDDGDGSERSAGPFPRGRAESLVAAFREMAPQRTYYVRRMPEAVDALQLGRIQRRRISTTGH
jgi:hypothetical protein